MMMAQFSDGIPMWRSSLISVQFAGFFMARVAMGHIFLKYFSFTLPALIHPIMYEVCHFP